MARSTFQVISTDQFNDVSRCSVGVFHSATGDPNSELRVEDIHVFPRGSGGWHDQAATNPLQPLPGAITIQRSSDQTGGTPFEVFNMDNFGAAVPSQIKLVEDPALTVDPLATIGRVVLGPQFTPTLTGWCAARIGRMGSVWARRANTNIQPITLGEGQGIGLITSTDGPAHLMGVWVIFQHGTNWYWGYRTCTLGGRDWFVGLFNGVGSGNTIKVERIGFQELGTTEPPTFAVTWIDSAIGGDATWEKMDTNTSSPPAAVRPLVDSDVGQGWPGSGLPGTASSVLYSFIPGSANSPIRIMPVRGIGGGGADMDFRTIFPIVMTGQHAGILDAGGRIPPFKRFIRNLTPIRVRPGYGVAIQRTNLSAYGTIYARLTVTYVPAPAAAGELFPGSRLNAGIN